MRTININKNKQIIIDDKDFELVNQYKWTYTKPRPHHPETSRCIKLNRIEIDNFIMKPSNKTYIYHINGNRLDCRRENMILMTKSQFEATKPPKVNNKTGLKGVSWKTREQSWMVTISVNGKNLYLGLYKNIIEAALVYNDAAIRYHGNYAFTNDLEMINAKVIHQNLRINEKYSASLNHRWGKVKKENERKKIENRVNQFENTNKIEE